MMRVGITLPQFSDDVELAVAVARDAEAAGLDGVFVFDHLWPIGQPDRPSIHSLALLGALAAETARIDVGTLVARVGLLPDAVLVNALATVARMVGPSRLIAGVGTGDKLSRAENEAYGVPYEPAAVRLERVRNVVSLLGERGLTAWVGGRSEATRALAQSLGVPLNLWTPTLDELHGDVTWGGPVRPDDDVGSLLGELARRGVGYAVCAPVGFEWREAAAIIASSASAVRQ